MAKTFKSISGSIHALQTDLFHYRVDCDTDILSDEISAYYVVEDDSKIQVDEEVYNAVKEYLENL